MFKICSCCDINIITIFSNAVYLTLKITFWNILNLLQEVVYIEAFCHFIYDL